MHIHIHIPASYVYFMHGVAGGAKSLLIAWGYKSKQKINNSQYPGHIGPGYTHRDYENYINSIQFIIRVHHANRH